MGQPRRGGVGKVKIPALSLHRTERQGRGSRHLLSGPKGTAGFSAEGRFAPTPVEMTIFRGWRCSVPKYRARISTTAFLRPVPSLPGLDSIFFAVSQYFRAGLFYFAPLGLRGRRISGWAWAMVRSFRVASRSGGRRLAPSFPRVLRLTLMRRAKTAWLTLKDWRMADQTPRLKRPWFPPFDSAQGRLFAQRTRKDGAPSAGWCRRRSKSLLLLTPVTLKRANLRR